MRNDASAERTEWTTEPSDTVCGPLLTNHTPTAYLIIFTPTQYGVASTAESVTSCRVTLRSEVVVERDPFGNVPKTEVESKDM